MTLVTLNDFLEFVWVHLPDDVCHGDLPNNDAAVLALSLRYSDPLTWAFENTGIGYKIPLGMYRQDLHQRITWEALLKWRKEHPDECRETGEIK